jgi:hypothetical protein
MFLFVKNLGCNLNKPILAKGVQQITKIFIAGLDLTKTFNVIESTNGLACKASGDKSTDQDQERGGCGEEVVLVHFDNELPSEIELADLGDEVDEEVVGSGGERRGREGLGVVEKGEGDLGRVFEAEEGLVEEVRGESDAVELERGLHGVEGVVVVEQHLRDGLGLV